MSDKTVIPCDQCRGLLRVPSDRGPVNVTCPRCHATFIWTADPLFTGSLPIIEALKKLRLRLLDLTLHNRLLNFRHSPGKCIQFVDAQLSIVFHRLMEGTDKRILLSPIPEPHRGEWTNIGGRLTRPDAKDYAKKISINPSLELVLSDKQTNNVNSVSTRRAFALGAADDGKP